MNKSERQVSWCPAFKNRPTGSPFPFPHFQRTQKSLSRESLGIQPWQPEIKEKGRRDAQFDQESSPTLFPFNQTLPYTCYIQTLALLSNPKRQQQWQQQAELVSDQPSEFPEHRRAKRQVKFYKINGKAVISELLFEKGREQGVYTGSGSPDFHLGAPLGQYFAKPGVCNLLIKVFTLGQLTRLISPGRHVLWPQGKLNHIRNILQLERESRERRSFCLNNWLGGEKNYEWSVPSFMEKWYHSLPKQRLKVRWKIQKEKENSFWFCFTDNCLSGDTLRMF